MWFSDCLHQEKLWTGTWACAKISRSFRFILSSTADSKDALRCSSVTVPVPPGIVDVAVAVTTKKREESSHKGSHEESNTFIATIIRSKIMYIRHIK